jgi:GDPmannose 4,6-dehydratase
VTDARRALITGLTGQDGSFLLELLLDRGYDVSGICRDERESLGPVEHLRSRVSIFEGDLLAPATIDAAVRAVAPDEIYHLAAPTFVPDSWRRPSETFAAIAVATTSLLESVRDCCPTARVFIASSSEMFGDAGESPQSEDSPCRPRHPYGAAKLAAHQLAGQFRSHEGLFVCSGILYNHESERRPASFVTRKITRAAAAIKLGRERELLLGDLSSVRDWSFAGDVMSGAWLALQHDAPNDYVFASGRGHTVREWLERAFAVVDLDPEEFVAIDASFVRQTESTAPVGNPARARTVLDWAPRVDFAHLIERMVRADLAELEAA